MQPPKWSGEVNAAKHKGKNGPGRKRTQNRAAVRQERVAKKRSALRLPNKREHGRARLSASKGKKTQKEEPKNHGPDKTTTKPRAWKKQGFGNAGPKKEAARLHTHAQKGATRQAPIKKKTKLKVQTTTPIRSAEKSTAHATSTRALESRVLPHINQPARKTPTERTLRSMRRKNKS